MDACVTLKLTVERDSEDIMCPERYLTKYHGEIVATNDQDETVIVGTLSGRLMDIKSAKSNGIYMEEYFDLDDHMDDYFFELFDIDTCGLKYDIQNDFEVSEYPVVLVVDLLVVNDAHRGKGYAVSAFKALIDQVGKGCDIAVLQAVPLQHSSNSKISDGISLGKYSILSKSEAQEKLLNHYAKAGFREYGDEGYMLLRL